MLENFIHKTKIAGSS